MMKSSLRRTAARVAVAGAIALIPVAALTATASADVPVTPSAGDVAWPHHNDNDNPWWNNDRDDWRHRHDHDHDGWNNNNGWNNPWNNPWNNGPNWRDAIVPGAFGSS